jgi:hypothetical protein
MGRTSRWYTVSVMNGMKGQSTWAKVTSTSYNVA